MLSCKARWTKALPSPSVVNSESLWLSITNAGYVVGGGGDIVTNVVGNAFVPKTPEAFSYDADGNLTTNGRWALTWDAENRLVAMESLSSTPTNSWRKLVFEYDPFGRRISQSVSNWVDSAWTNTVYRRYVYDGWNLVAELDESNTPVRSYLWGTDLSGTLHGAGGVGGLLVVDDAAEEAHFVAYDGNGNVTTLIQATNSSVTAQYEYDPFGRTIRATGIMAGSNPFRFSSKYHDDETDLVYYGYRYLKDGRWLSRDPVGESGGLNLYGYVGNDPVNAVDPLGLFTIDALTCAQVDNYLKSTRTILKYIESSMGKLGKIDVELYEKGLKEIGATPSGLIFIGPVGDTSSKGAGILEATKDAEQDLGIGFLRLSMLGGTFISDGLSLAAEAILGDPDPDTGPSALMQGFLSGEYLVHLRQLRNLEEIKQECECLKK